MSTRVPIRTCGVVLLLALLLGSCAVPVVQQPSVIDIGKLVPQQAAPAKTEAEPVPAPYAGEYADITEVLRQGRAESAPAAPAAFESWYAAEMPQKPLPARDQWYAEDAARAPAAPAAFESWYAAEMPQKPLPARDQWYAEDAARAPTAPAAFESWYAAEMPQKPLPARDQWYAEDAARAPVAPAAFESWYAAEMPQSP